MTALPVAAIATVMPLLGAHATAAAHVALGAVAVMALLLLDRSRRLRRQRDRAHQDIRDLQRRLVEQQEATAAARGEVDDARNRSDRGVEIMRDAVRRTHLLEQLLAGAVGLQARRDEADLQQYAVEMACLLFGFQRAALYLWSDSCDAFAMEASVGLDDGERRRLAEQHVDRAGYDQLAHPRFRVSESYLVPPDDAPWPLPTPADEGHWPDGQRLVVPLIDPAGTVHGFLDLGRPREGASPDLLGIRYLELLARQLAAIVDVLALRERLAGARSDLALANDRLQSLHDLRSNFVANVSHELRTPLTVVIGYTELLRGRGETMSPDARGEFLDHIHQESRRLEGIIEDLLDLDRREEDAVRSDRNECDVVQLVERQAEEWRRRAADARQQVTVVCEAPSLPLAADPLLLQQLLSHLVGNALKFTPEGGDITVRVAEQGTAARIEVEDTGIGIPEDKLHTVFERFYQVDGSSTRAVGGQGVGLSICQNIVSRHDGRIWAENIDGGGTRLTVLLPRRAPVVVPEPPVSPDPALREPRLFMQRMAHWVADNVGARAVVLLTVGDDGQDLRVLAATGVPAGQLEDLRLAEGVGLAGRAWSEAATVLDTPLAGDPLLAGEQPVLCVPLVQDGRAMGVVAVRDTLDGRDLGDDHRLLLESMAPRLAYLLERHDDHGAVTRDYAAIQHSLRVTTRVGALPHADVASVCEEICLATARRLGLPDDELRHLAFALRHYDVGLGSVPPYLLGKSGDLSDAERAMLERHVGAGISTLEPLQPPSNVRQIILHHHENYDGSGYPRGLVGEAIPLGSRLVALTDSLRALLQRRPWRPAATLPEALTEIEALVGVRYCPRVTALFIEEARRRRDKIADLRQRADDGEDLRRPVPVDHAPYAGP